MPIELILTGCGVAGNAGTQTYLGGCTVTVPDDQYWQPTAVHIKYVSCAAAGDRVAQVTFGDYAAITAGFVIWEPVQAASQTRYFDAYIGTPSRTTYINSDHAIAPLPPGQILAPLSVITPRDAASICDNGLFTNTATAIDATTLTSVGHFVPGDFFAGANLVVGSSTAVVTANDADVLTFAGGWTGGTPTAPATYLLYFDTLEFSLSYNQYEAVQH